MNQKLWRQTGWVPYPTTIFPFARDWETEILLKNVFDIREVFSENGLRYSCKPGLSGVYNITILFYLCDNNIQFSRFTHYEKTFYFSNEDDVDAFECELVKLRLSL